MKLRLQRYLADCGVASRRACEQLISSGRVRVNGQVPTTTPVIVDPDEDVITIGEQIVSNKAGSGVKQITRTLVAQDKVYYLLNKPKGILVTNYDPSERKTVSELMTGVPERVFPIGRLDMDSRGALIMTNDGELTNRLTHPKFTVEKTYVVATEGHMSSSDLEKIKKGMWFGPEHKSADGGPQRGMRVEGFKLKVLGRGHGGPGGHTMLEIKISEGKNSHIRRVMARLGHPVRDLNRVAIAGKITTRGLEVGEYRKLTPEEVKWLFHASSPEFLERTSAATQAWYEQKELEKERKRLAKGETTPPPTTRSTPRSPQRHGKPGFKGRSYGKPARDARPSFGFARPGKFGPGAGRKPFEGKPTRPRGEFHGGKPTRAVQPPRPPIPENRPRHPLGEQAQSDD